MQAYDIKSVFQGYFCVIYDKIKPEYCLFKKKSYLCSAFRKESKDILLDTLSITTTRKSNHQYWDCPIGRRHPIFDDGLW
jgi:hypothetical protein